ncbi:hypothetical protein PanWU01x14_319020 [Parasponia andersonii]|uniref:Uncharacterized protein n=1 Tax=Parasponia andersonii TaxID=3476 RepID=A0A2P5AME6_PARAD|nr:hypothetical protein PanWU01x14_319020 [Parasponia andersonii]
MGPPPQPGPAHPAPTQSARPSRTAEASDPSSEGFLCRSTNEMCRCPWTSSRAWWGPRALICRWLSSAGDSWGES